MVDFFFLKFDHFLVSFWCIRALKGRAKDGRAYYTGLAFCGFRVQIDEFNHSSSLQAAKTRVVPPGHMSSLTSVPEALLCVGLSTWVFACELIELTELSENFVLVMVLFSWWGFLVAHSINSGGEGDYSRLPSLNLLSGCTFSFDFITLHQFDPISYSLYFSNIRNQ